MAIFKFIKRDKDGWPLWKSNPDAPNLNSKEQDVLLKEGIIKYFEDAQINFLVTVGFSIKN